jgi:hypothetical protein
LNGFAIAEYRNERTGAALAALGDLDGDGISELAVGTPGRGDEEGAARGAVWILFLDTEGGVKCAREITVAKGGLAGQPRDRGEFGSALAAVGDLDGDGITELAVGEPDPVGGTPRIWLLFLAPDGTVRAQRRIDAATPGMPGLSGRSKLGFAFAAPGDIDGDGIADLVAGAPEDEPYGNGYGSLVSIFFSDFVGRTAPPGPATMCDVPPETPEDREGEYYDVTIELLTPRQLGAFQVAVDYSSVAGDFRGSRTDVDCTALSEAGVLAVMNDCDSSTICEGRVLRLGLISVRGFTGPARVATCTFVSRAGPPDPDDFVLRVEDAATPSGRSVDAEGAVTIAPREAPE